MLWPLDAPLSHFPLFGLAALFVSVSAMVQEKSPQVTVMDASPELRSINEALPEPATSPAETGVAPKDFFFMPVPTYLRRTPEEPASFSLLLNLVFAIAGTFCKPLLRLLSVTSRSLYGSTRECLLVPAYSQ